MTISYQGGPGVTLNVFQAVRAWLAPSEAVVPESELFPPGQTAQQTQQQDTEQMASSQELATAAALNELHIPFQTQVQVLSTAAGYPASKSLKAGDVIQKGGRPGSDRLHVAQLDDHRAPGGQHPPAPGASVRADPERCRSRASRRAARR